MELRQPIHAGLTIGLIGYTSSFAVVLSGLRAVGASPAQATSGLIALCLALGLGTIWLSIRHEMPLTLAWSTPGAAVLTTTGAVAGGWQAAVGAFVLTGALMILTGLWPRLGSLIAAIPPPIAQATLAGVVLELCLAPVRGLASHPGQIVPILVTWLLLSRLAPRWAVPAAFAVTLVVVGVEASRHGGVHGPWLPHPDWITPHLTTGAIIGVAIPLYIVTMAAQNVPGAAIIGSYGFAVPWRESMTVTGIGTILGAPFGGHAINLAAISAAVPASAEAHPDPRRRWPAATAFGVLYVGLAVLSAALTSYVAAAPPEVIGAVAGVGLLGTLGSALSAAVAEVSERTPAAITFVVAASGVTLAGVGAAFWALAAGLLVRAVLTTGGRRRTMPHPQPAPTGRGG